MPAEIKPRSSGSKLAAAFTTPDTLTNTVPHSGSRCFVGGGQGEEGGGKRVGSGSVRGQGGQQEGRPDGEPVRSLPWVFLWMH